MKRAIVIGSAGQDGYYLSQQLREAGYDVIGVERTGVSSGGSALPPRLDLLDRSEVHRFLATASDVTALFYLAAFHHSSEEAHDGQDALLLRQSFSIHLDAWLNVLEAVQRSAPACRMFYAASSHVFGDPSEAIQDENTALAPTNAYGISKTAGLHVARYFRARGLHASVGILFNHESERRALKFVSQRIAHGAAQAARAARTREPYKLELGNLAAVVDWGYAPDYTRAMLAMLEHDRPDDYVVASGRPHTVADFCEAAFSSVGLDWREFVVEQPRRITKQLTPLIGNPVRLRGLGWEPSLTFEEMVQRMVAAAETALARPR